jgi:DNA-binding response OmpR family regulator
MTDTKTCTSTPTHPWLFTRGRWDLTEPGAGCYRGVRFTVNGTGRKLLVRFVRSRGTALSYAELMDALGNALMSFETLKSHVSRLRNLLRRALGHLPDSPANPIASVDDMAYRFDLPG